MDWTTITELASEQGAVFWAAAAAIALGLTLLLAALVQGARQAMVRRRGSPTAGAPAADPAPAGPSSPAPGVPGAPASTASIDQAAATTAYAAPGGWATPAAQGDESLALLLRRLQAAGDHLEQIAADLGQAPVADVVSPLKSSLQDVEYVFRAGGS
ncbi:hypothetical protein GF314_07635 [bacterium]|nr:hypothetical protein [bacterium]